MNLLFYNNTPKNALIFIPTLHAMAHYAMYSQTCIKRSPLGQTKSGLIRQVTS